jgi:oligopeptide/dipeptide ABC transporter ATP-binding protein
MTTNFALEVKDLKVHFIMKRALIEDLFSKKKKVLKAVDGISFNLAKGEILSLVGESGSGKTTTGKAILQLVEYEGEVKFFGEEVNPKNKHFMHRFRQKAQMIFQDPYQSVNPREIVMDIVAEPLDVNHLVKTKQERRARVKLALEQAGMVPAEDFYNRYPHELSGGQRQRVVLASSMIMDPNFIVADEPVSMLDASIRTGILRLMLDIRDSRQISYLFITHDLSLAWLISDRIAIMYLGKIMEIGTADEIIHRGIHPYTSALTAIMPTPGVNRRKERIVLPGETPSPIDDLHGCKFNSRCPLAQDICWEESPQQIEIDKDHLVACHFAREIKNKQ